MSTNLLKYFLTVENPKTKALILLVLISPSKPVSLSKKSTQKPSAILFVIQAVLIVALGINSAVSGTPRLSVIVQMTAQGVNLIINAHRAQNSSK